MSRRVVLFLGLLAIMTQPVLAEQPLRLFFEKNIQVETKPEGGHKVQEGEWLYGILKAKGYSAARIKESLAAIQALNPHIPDINRLKPGQIIHIPDALPAANVTRNTAPVPPGSFEKVPYVIRPGDTLVQVLQAQGVPTKLIFGKYLNLFLELNPDVPDTNTLRAGQKVVLPVLKAEEAPPAVVQTPVTPAEVPAGPEPLRAPHNERPFSILPEAPAPTLTAPAASTSTPPPVPQAEAPPTPPVPLPSTPVQTDNATADANATKTENAKQPRAGLPLVRAVLEKMRFRFTPGDESMFPLPRSGWLHVRLQETPLIEPPWGGKALLCPVPKSTEWITGADQLGMKVCVVSSRWSLQDVLEKLAVAFPDRFRLWETGRDLVLTHDGVSVTLQSPQLVISERGGKKSVYMVWARQSVDEPALPQGLHEVLEEAQVKVIELDAMNEFSRLPSRPRESIYVPVATHLDIVRVMNPDNPEALFGQTLPDNLNSLLQLLRDKELLHRGMVQASWFGGARNRITLQVPAWTVSGTASRIALLDRRFADPYLVSVLAHEGYSCFILPD